MDVLVRPLLNSDMSISRFGVWGSGFKFRVLGFGFWVLVFWFLVFGFWFDIKQNPGLEPGGFSEAKIQ